MKRVGPQNASRHRTGSDLIGPNLNSVRFLRPEMSAQERTRCTQRVKMEFPGFCGHSARCALHWFRTPPDSHLRGGDGALSDCRTC
jgi:hypothetical protein